MYLSRQKMVKTALIATVAVICLIIVAIITKGVNHFKVGSQLASIHQVSNLSHLLVRQQAKLFSLMLLKNTPTEELVDALNQFAAEEFVLDANLYAASGTLLAQSHNALPFKPTLNRPDLPPTQQIVEPIFAQQDLIGFLRVTFDSEYGQTARYKVDQLFHLLYAELIILFLSGGLFVSCFYYFRRTHSPVHLPRMPAKNEGQSSKRFHSRRRLFRHR